MRIQHNIAALNSYRQLGGNNGAVSKNLEKLSSGYKINRAGDDAAGLAISEKMRAQITGLETAQSNAQDGISLIQTAEGNLQEVHSMLNRMVELATQSSNGTYDNDVDRANLQKEVASLSSEIDRIAESANFNGIKLLDGSLSKEGVGGVGGKGEAVKVETELNNNELVVKDVASTKGEYSIAAFGANSIKDGETLKISVSLSDGTVKTVQLTARNNTDSTPGGELYGADGLSYGKYSTNAGAAATEIADAFVKAMKNSDLANDFKISADATGAIKLTNIVAGADATQVMKDINVKSYDKNGTMTETVKTATATNGVDAYQTLDVSQFKEYNGADSSILTINGKKFAILVQDGTVATDELMKKATDAGLELIMVSSVSAGSTTASGDGDLHLDAADASTALVGAATAQAAASAQGNSLAAALSKALGYKVEFNAAMTNASGATVAANLSFKIDTTIDPSKKTGGGLTLQIGESSEDYQKVTVNVGKMDAKSLGIGSIDVGNQKDAAVAIDKIKAAINSVSSTRGDLGAIQNRLEHTINNLGVTTENMTAAESRIRDTDMAKEMMEYTKNNILVQASQAMLAQANQLPQGVLQLLQ